MLNNILKSIICESVTDSGCTILAEHYYVSQGLEVFVVCAFENAD